MHGESNPEPNKRGYTEGLPRCVQRERVSARLYDIELDDPVPPVQIQPHRIPGRQCKKNCKPWRRMDGLARSTHQQSGCPSRR